MTDSGVDDEHSPGKCNLPPCCSPHSIEHRDHDGHHDEVILQGIFVNMAANLEWVDAGSQDEK
jgi:hypothetical protein